MTQKPEITDAALDALLTEWATRPVTGDAHAVAAAVLRPRAWPRWAAGAGLAASVALALVLVVPPGPVAPDAPTAIAAAASTPTEDAALFADVFTPMPEEESLL